MATFNSLRFEPFTLKNYETDIPMWRYNLYLLILV